MTNTELSSRLNITNTALADFCRRWRVTELAVFGSILRDDFGPDSDIDLLVTFEPDSPWSLFDIVTMKLEAEALFGRPIDIVSRRGVEQHTNPWAKHLILSTAKPIFSAA